MNTAVILLGSNIGEPAQNLANALFKIEHKAGKVIKASLIYETEPWGRRDQPDFLNQVIEISTLHDPYALLKILLEIEENMGRSRIEKWAPRLIDLDILYFNSNIIKEEGLTVPHPYLHERRFTLQPLAEILPDFVHPVIGKTNKMLLESIKDDMAVKPLKPAMNLKGH